MVSRVVLLKKILGLSLLLGFTLLSHAQQNGQPLLEASVERQTVVDGESVLLYLKGEGLRELPDVSALSKQFDVLDSRRSNSQIIENGVVKSQFLMRFELLPKNLGQTIIPVFTADGVSTQPVTIDVVARDTPGVVPRDKVFAELTLDKSSVYVQAQVVLSLHILDDGSLASVDPPLPVIPDVQVEKLPGGDQRIETRDGEEYRVHTWRYALFPQRQGEIEIPRMLIPGGVRDPSYGGGLIMRSMATRRIQIRTNGLVLTAEPRAPASTAEWWLPVENLQVQHQWSADIANVTVGEPLTLTFSVTTAGATSNQLPEIEAPDTDGLKIYPDVPDLQSNATDTGLISRRQEKWSVIPQRAGTITIPATTVKWWDTVADVEREAVLPAQTMVVAADPEQTTSAPPVQSLVQQNPPVVTGAGSSQQQTDAAINAESALWKPVAVFAMLGWLATAMGWAALSIWPRRKQTKMAAEPVTATSTSAFQALEHAARGNDLAAFREKLLAWARLKWPGESIVGPLDIARKLDSDALSSECRAFEASLYSGAAADVDTGRIYRLLQAGLTRADRHQEQNDYLPSL